MIIKQKSTLILYLLSILSYILFYTFIVGFDQAHDKDYLIFISAVVIVFFQLLLIHMKSNNRLLKSSIIFLMFFSLFELLKFIYPSLHSFMYEKLILRTIYESLIMILIGCHGIGIYLELLNQEKQKTIHIGTYESNEVLFIELLEVTKKVRIEYSESFAKKYHIEHKVSIYTFDSFNDMIAHHENNPCKTIDDCIRFGENHKLSVKFPDIQDQVHLLIKRTMKLQKRAMLILIDITNLSLAELTLEKSRKTIDQLETESQKIIKNTGVYISKMKPDGTIIFASDALSSLYTKEKEGIIGLNAIKLSEKQGNTDHSWFTHTLEEGHSLGNSTVLTKQGLRHITWKNDCLYNDQGEVEYLITVGTDVTDITNLNQKLKYQSTHDTLTGLLNYQGLIEHISNLDTSKKIVSFFIDIKDLSNVRDYYGNDIGDIILERIAKELTCCAFDGDLVSRYYGDQFVIISHDINEKKLTQKISHLNKHILSLYHVNQIHVQIKKSIGYAIYPDDADTFEKLITESSLAMKKAQNSKHNEIIKYNSTMTDDLNQNISIAYHLHQAIINQKIEVYFQKVINTKNHQVYCIEALARWRDETMGFIRPDYFFEVAQNSNLIDLLEDYVVYEAIKSFSHIKKNELFKDTKLSLNLTPHTLLKNGFAKTISKHITDHDILPKEVIIEVSENTFVHNLDTCNHFIKTYQNEGFLIAIDDFGSQFSSLSILEKISYDIIKIDGSFIQALDQEKNMIIIKMIKSLAEVGNKQMIAEAVETKEISEKLCDMGCVLQQGYYFHKPEKIVIQEK